MTRWHLNSSKCCTDGWELRLIHRLWHEGGNDPSLGKTGAIITISISFKLQILLPLWWFFHWTVFNNNWASSCANSCPGCKSRTSVSQRVSATPAFVLRIIDSRLQWQTDSLSTQLPLMSMVNSLLKIIHRCLCYTSFSGSVTA